MSVNPPLVRWSQYLLPTLKEHPVEAQIVSHALMLRAGMVQQATSGIYSWLPLGLRVLNNIADRVREEQNRIGALELLMPTIQSAELWRRSGRYDDYGLEMLRMKDRHGRDMLYGPTNEELITEILAQTAPTMAEIPKLLYHIQWKFRDEIRPRFGVMRGREFFMKDAYSFDLDAVAGQLSYNKMFISYLRLFHRIGLRAIPMRAETGPIGGQHSHEFIVLADTGESAVFCDGRVLDLAAQIPSYDPGMDDPAAWQGIVDQWTQYYAATEEEHDPARFAEMVPEAHQVARRGIEVGHIFHFGTKYSDAMGCAVRMTDGEMRHVLMGSYGVGVSRLAGAMIEASHDGRGIIWHSEVAPFTVGISIVSKGDVQAADGTTVDAAAQQCAEACVRAGLSVLIDDRSERAGVKFADLDLIGLPFQVVIGKGFATDGTIEWRYRGDEARTTCTSIDDVVLGITSELQSRKRV